MLMRLTMVDIDYADYVSAANQGNRKERFVRVFDKSLETLEPAIGTRIGGERDYRMVLDHPTRYTFAGLEPYIAEVGLVGNLRSSQNNFVCLALDQVDKTRVTICDLHRNSNDFAQHLVD
jgi:hypothetical protein